VCLQTPYGYFGGPWKKGNKEREEKGKKGEVR